MLFARRDLERYGSAPFISGKFTSGNESFNRTAHCPSSEQVCLDLDYSTVRSKEGKIETSLSGKSEIVAIVYICYSVMFSTLCKFQSACLGGGILKTTNLCFPKQ